MRKKTTPRSLRMAEYYQLLEFLAGRPLPVVCVGEEVVERVLALRSALLVEAQVEAQPVLLRAGERRMGRAVVTAITTEGRNALSRNTRWSFRARHAR
ncbi:hypothetical protein ACSFA8_19130 [Variovorax sp. RT4R15]|uniref:hypothetical protein n=1 Tax=Variovorax sp. RT4R15 TaxID=3443737 RepID=UPI003F46B747